MIEYICPDCDISEFDIKIIPKKKCPDCHLLMDAVENE
jgi:hypothetical protein